MKKRKIISVSILSLFVSSLMLSSAPHDSYAGPETVVKIDAASGVHDISPLIYGVSFGDERVLKNLNIPINRSGGASKSTYNWKNDSENSGDDGYYESMPVGNPDPNALPDGSSSDLFHELNRANGAQTMLTIPLLGFVAKDRERRASFPVSRFGVQQDNDINWFPDAGSGRLRDMTRLQNDPLDTYIKVDENYMKEWIGHLKGKYGTAAQGGVKYYLLDNEPGLWADAHWDAVKTAPHDDEFIDLSIRYANMIKNTDPSALTAGYEDWGCFTLMNSPYDMKYMFDKNDLSLHPDRDKNGYGSFAEYYLKRMREAEKVYGKRLLDVFTTHYLPQGGETNGWDDPETQARRMRTTRILWDPNYVEENLQKEKIYLIPRIKEYVNSFYPGTGTGITGYCWGGLEYPDGGIAQADILGIFGREGLSIGNLSKTLKPGTPGYNAFLIYRNYDGKKSTFGDKSVKCTVPNPDELSSFASLDSKTGEMKIMIINKNPVSETPIAIDIKNFKSNGCARVFQWAGRGSLSQQPNKYFKGSQISLTVPPYSATIIVAGREGTAVPSPSDINTPVPSATPTPPGVQGILRIDQNNAKQDSQVQVCPRVTLTNTGNEAIKLKDITIRYYFTMDGGIIDQNFECWRDIVPYKVTHKFIALAKPCAGADHYLELGFTGDTGELQPGQKVNLVFWFGKKDWSSINQLNDYSFNESMDSLSWTRTAAYVNGALNWGREPGEAIDITTPPATPTPTPTQNLTEHKITGCIVPGLQYEESAEKEVRQGFKVELEGTEYSAVTDENGCFEIKGIPPNKRLYRLKISKPGYLTRYFEGIGVVKDLIIGTKASPVELWAGDIAIKGQQDGVIGMPDVMELAKAFNKGPKDNGYNRDLDFNKDNSINMKDILIVVKHFNKMPEDYPPVPSNN